MAVRTPSLRVRLSRQFIKWGVQQFVSRRNTFVRRHSGILGLEVKKSRSLVESATQKALCIVQPSVPVCGVRSFQRALSRPSRARSSERVHRLSGTFNFLSHRGEHLFVGGDEGIDPIGFKLIGDGPERNLVRQRF